MVLLTAPTTATTPLIAPQLVLSIVVIGLAVAYIPTLLSMRSPTQRWRHTNLGWYTQPGYASYATALNARTQYTAATHLQADIVEGLSRDSRYPYALRTRYNPYAIH